MVLARRHVLCETPGGRRHERIGQEVERDRQRIGRLGVLAHPARARDELAIERFTDRPKEGSIRRRVVGAPEHRRRARHQIGGVRQKRRRDQVRPRRRARI